jgi:hypothetical protein
MRGAPAHEPAATDGDREFLTGSANRAPSKPSYDDTTPDRSAPRLRCVDSSWASAPTLSPL